MKIAIILSGCGNRDGSELQETLSLMLAFDRRDWDYTFFAPQDTFQVVSHLDNHDGGQRDIYEESARIARGDIHPIDQYDADQFDALALPGGMGAARNLSTYAFDAEAMTVRPDVQRPILETFQAHKPILAMCIAPMVLAKVLGSYGVTLTLGGNCAASQVAERLGAKHHVCGPTDYCFDPEHLIFTTPAYMVGTRISQIFAGAENMVAALEKEI